ncbi:hypothetical protein T06_9436 [Trichinella sp. T6]|nr:hypothetical protein T06_9436 [Trichinella sp. T6]
MTAEYDGGTRRMEQFLRAVAYDVLQPGNFQVPSFLHPYFVSGICYFEVLVIAHGAPQLLSDICENLD